MEANRLYRISDSEMLEFAKVIAAQARTDLPILASFDTTLTADRINELEHQIAEISTVYSDNVIIDRLAQLTAEVNRIEESCISAYRKIRFFIQKAFKDNVAIQNQFGLNDYEEASRSQAKMILFMKEFALVVEEYRQNLLEAGATPQLLDSAKQLAQEYDQANQAQELFKNKRPVLTQERVNRLNHIYSEVKYICEVASFAFEGDYANSSRYAIPQPPSNSSMKAEASDSKKTVSDSSFIVDDSSLGA